MKIIDYGHSFHVYWEYNQWHKRNLEAVKSFGITQHPSKYVVEKDKATGKETGRRFWVVAGVHRLTVEQWKETHAAKIVTPEELKPEEIGLVPPMAELIDIYPWKEDVVARNYQKQGVAQAMKFERCLIGDEQGLGKTMTSIGTIVALEMNGKQSFPCIVICPSSTKLNWQREWHKFSNKRAMVLSGNMPAQKRRNWFSYVQAGLIDVVIVNYESVATFCVESYPQEKTKTGKKKPWKSGDIKLRDFMNLFNSGILDESHRCKDASTNQSKFILRIFNGLKYRLLLSGTPVVNKPIDLFPQLAILGVLTKMFQQKLSANGKDISMTNISKFFKDRYCDGGTGASNLRELNYLMNYYAFFRREKKDVAKDLPPKDRQTILCDITNREDYNRVENDFKSWLAANGCDENTIDKKLAGEAIVKMMQLKTIAAKGKMNEVKEFVNEVLEGGNKLILFCHLHEIVDECLKLWPGAVTVTGRDNDKNRNANIDRFQNDPSCQLIICNHKAAGVGITLTASSRVAFIEYPWTYADCVQCEDRAHRIGQIESVTCTYFLGQDTVDERMWELIYEKMNIGNTITGASDQMEMEMVDNTLQLFNNKKAVI